MAAVVAFVPASALTLAAGAVFGLAVGTVTASLASTTGAAASFLISRYLARGLVTRKFGDDPRFAAIDREISRSGALIVALLRLSPAVPFGLQNYLYGLTGIGFWTYLLTSWAAMLPGTVMYVYLGYLGRAGLDAAGGSGRTRTPLEWALLAVGLAATVAVTLRRDQARTTGTAGSGSPDIPGGPESDDPHMSNGFRFPDSARSLCYAAGWPSGQSLRSWRSKR